MATLSIKDVRKSYGSVQVLHGVDIELEDGGFLVLLGPSGCGKSTLLNMIAGLDDTSWRRHPDRRTLRRGPCTQGPQYRDGVPVLCTLPHHVGREKYRLRIGNAGHGRRPAKRAVDEAARLLQISHLLDRRPANLSGGQRQRVAMGRAIVRKPELFLFDEPLSNLDAKLRVEMRTEIKRLHERLGTSIVYVTHDQIEAMTLGTKVAVMKGGHIQQLADPRTIYQRPANMFVASFIGSPAMNFLPGRLIPGPARRAF